MASTSNRTVSLVILALAVLAVGIACNPASSSRNQGSVLSVSVMGGAPLIAVDGTLQLTAAGGYRVSATEITYKDVTASTTWSTSDKAVAIVDKGLVTGTGIGSATIAGTFGGKSDSITVFVGLVHSLTVSPSGTFSLASPSIQFFATETFADGSTLDVSGPAIWSSSNGGIVSIDPFLGGAAMLVAPGQTTVTATLDNGEVASSDVTVIP